MHHLQSSEDGGSARKRRRLNGDAGPFVLRPVLEDIPLQTEEQSEPVSITCVEYWNSNLYIGTSASEILHFVSLPSDEVDQSGPMFILASRLQPSGYGSGPVDKEGEHSDGVRQILVLPRPGKACVLCNGVVSFYTLPELSPAFPNKEPTGVQWIGGVDDDDIDNKDGPTVMIANSKRILLVRVGEKLRPVKPSIEYPNCLKTSRRGTIACVADGAAYALLEVEHQQKIPLFPISSVPDAQETERETSLEVLEPGLASRLAPDSHGHSRSTSLGTFMNRQPSPQSRDRDSRSLRLSDGYASLQASTNSPRNSNRPRSATDAMSSTSPQRATSPRKQFSLKPHILSPSPSEFLLTTGSGKEEPGVGIFVNLDGDVVRGTIEFDRYPDALTIDFASKRAEDSFPGQGDLEDTIFALMRRPSGEAHTLGIETQKLSDDPAAMLASKSWLPISKSSKDIVSAGVHFSLSSCEHMFPEVGSLLRLVRYNSIGRSPSLPANEPDARTKVAVERVEEEKALFESQLDETLPNASSQRKREAEELKLARSLGHTASQIVAWYGTDLWQIVANPEILQLESSLLPGPNESPQTVRLSKITSTLERIKSREAQTETEFLSLSYIRQKASMMLLLEIIKNATIGTFEHWLSLVENALLSSGVDPRLVLLLFPRMKDEVQESSEGIWIYNGLAELLKDSSPTEVGMESTSMEIWSMVRRFLSSWQEKRGYGSITDEQFVFDSVDASLLRLLLYLDQTLSAGSGSQVAARTKLNNVVDHWKGNFDRAVTLLEEHKRLFILSRLYQSQKLSKNVLQTWRRIADGELDLGGELSPAAVEMRVRQYLVHIRDSDVFREYCLWLAGRNANLAIELLTDDSCRVKFTPQEVTSMLKSHATGAVQQYLEYLVFNKRLEQYSDDLIGYYLDSVLSVLESSEEARTQLLDSYSTYRALEKPKPTYQNFITDNAPAGSWWQSRLRLLQLLGSGSYATAECSNDLTYSIPKVLERLAPFSAYLVSESIILDARQGHHKEALQLLTHGLGDYDTAIRYCYFGGPIASSSQPIDASSLPPRETQQDLFSYLFAEFLVIGDETERLERSSDLLGKFAAYFDPLTVFANLPDSWTVYLIEEFLLRTLRAVTSEYNAALILKALSAAQNLQKQAAFVEACEKYGMKVDGGGDQAVSTVVSSGNSG